MLAHELDIETLSGLCFLEPTLLQPLVKVPAVKRQLSVATGPSSRDFPHSQSAYFGNAGFASDSGLDEASTVPSGGGFEVFAAAPRTNGAAVGIRAVIVTKRSNGILQRVSSQNMILWPRLLVVIVVNQALDVEVGIVVGVVTRHFM